MNKYADREQGFESSLMNKLVGIYEDLGWVFPSMQSSVQSLTTKEGPYTYEEILTILQSPEWTSNEPMI
jgi:hypothetical protein